MEASFLYGAVAVAILGIVAISVAAPRIIRSLLTPSLSARRSVYTPDPQRLRSPL